MTFNNLLLESTNNVLIVTVNRPSALNALNRETMAELKRLFSEYAPSLPDLKGVVLTGAGEKAFVAGADISEFTGISGSEEGAAMSQYGNDVFALVERFHKPVIAAINGFALGGGCELAMSCHMRIASEKAKFGQPEVNLGLIPGYGGTQRLVQMVGKGKALELMMTADMINAQEAQQLGLVNHVVESGSEVGKAIEIIEKIATKAPIAVAKVIECVNAYYQEGEDGFAREVKEFGVCANTKDFREGAEAFLNKRKPSWSNQ